MKLAIINKRARKQHRKARIPRNPLIIQKNGFRPRINFDGFTLNGNTLFGGQVTAANIVVFAYLLDTSSNNYLAGNTRVESASIANQNIFQAYSEFRYMSLRLTWIPHVSPGVADGGSPMYICYIDNPEMITSVTAGTLTTAQTLTNIKQVRNMKTFNAWQTNFTFNVPVTHRIKWFNINITEAMNDVNIGQRSIQGLVLAGAESISAAADLGAWRAEYSIELRGLQNNFAT